MEITQQLQDFARSRGVNEARAKEMGLAEKAEEFRRAGGVL
jgi:phosphomethylpyrimidine synthase